MTSEVHSEPKFNVYEAITRKIITLIEVGVNTYSAPWHAPAGRAMHPTNAATGATYRGVNVLVLWADTLSRGYVIPLWASYRQWQQIGAQVRNGERGALVVFYRRSETTPFEAEDHDRTGKLRFIARSSWVFNAAQVDGYVPEVAKSAPMFERIQEVEAFVQAVQAAVRHGFAGACYRPKGDIIEMPEREWFIRSGTSSPEEGYYAVLLHELTHWVGAPHRLNREFGKRFGDRAYAMEELVAELGAAFMCAAFGISTEPRPDHASYVASWLEVLNRDSKAIFTAASKAQESFEHLAYLAGGSVEM